MKTILLELFSGCGGFAKGLMDSGIVFDEVYFSEVDKHAIANYSYNFKEAKYIGTVTNVRHIIRTINRQSGDRLIITLGSPCQNFSMAGDRTGLEGSKSSLIKYALVLIKWLRPDVYIWENVKGAYSSNNGADYWAIIKAFADIPGYRREQQLLNTSWVLPQNRERIYLVGHLAGRSQPGIFPFAESFGRDVERGQEYDTPIARTFTAGGHSGGQHSGMTLIKIASVSRTDEAKEIRKESMKNGRDYTPFQGKKIEFIESDTMNTVTTATTKDNLIEIVSNTKKGFETVEPGDSLNFSNPNSKTRRGRVGKGVAQTIDTQANQGVIQLNQNKNSGGQQPYQQDRVYDTNGLMVSLDTRSDQKNVLDNSNIRRLTEIECERLQGFPDDWTKCGIYNGIVKPIPKTQRYKLCGNAVTKDIVEMMAKRIKFL